MKKLTQRRGLTMLELVIAAGMIAIVTMVLISLFKASYQTYAFGATSGNLQLTTRSTLDRMTREMRQATSVSASNGTYTTGANILVLQLASIDASKNIIASTYDYVIYRLDPASPNKLQEITVAGAGSVRRNGTRTILNNVDSVTFTYYDASNTAITSTYTNTKRVRVQINASQTKFGKKIPVSYSEQATLRNK